MFVCHIMSSSPPPVVLQPVLGHDFSVVTCFSVLEVSVGVLKPLIIY